MTLIEARAPAAPAPERRARAAGLARGHWPLVVLLVAGAALRIAAWLAYRPALLFIDSFRYLENLEPLRPDQLNPLGYDLVLRPLLAVGGLGFVAAVQHVVGMAVAVVGYRLVRRLGARRWVATLAAAPLLLDGYQVQIEQNIMSEVWFQALLAGLLWLLVARGVPGWRRALAAGLVVGAAVLVRTIGIVLVLPLAGYLLLAGGAWRTRAGWTRGGLRCAAGLAGLAIVIVPYAAYFRHFTGDWGLSAASGNVLYGRTAEVADCAKLDLPPAVAQFCPAEPLGQRLGVDQYAHRNGDPDWPGPIPAGTTREALAHEFGMAVLRTQPLDVAGSVLRDFLKGFALTRTTSPTDAPVERWQFQLAYPLFDATDAAAVTQQYDGMPPTVNPILAKVLRGYQLSVGYTSGPLLAAGGLLGLFAAVGAGRARRSGLRLAALLVAGSGLVLLLGSAAFEFSWRYQLPGLVLLPLAGAIGLTALTSGPRRPRLAEFPDKVDAAALAAFHERYGRPSLSPLVVVIAAYNEADGLGPVLADMPKHCLGLPVDVLVVVDGATDGTAEVARAHGAYTCVAPRNRGQGAALRLGYRLAAACGAQYVVTTDADGQYDNREMPALLRPLLDGTADFVTGSRRLGREETNDRVRWLGVRVFAVLASVLTRHRITDTSFGFRALRADLACAVTLREPQYQSSELLLGLTGRGARVLEVPMTMRLRNSGASKKGRSLVYGANYARVMIGTWWRAHVLRRGRTRGGRAA